MPTLKDDLLAAVVHWRKKGEETELASTKVDKPFPQGYLRGVAATYENAAKRIEAILVANAPKVARRVLHGKRSTIPLA